MFARCGLWLYLTSFFIGQPGHTISIGQPQPTLVACAALCLVIAAGSALGLAAYTARTGDMPWISKSVPWIRVVLWAAAALLIACNIVGHNGPSGIQLKSEVSGVAIFATAMFLYARLLFKIAGVMQRKRALWEYIRGGSSDD
jgi:hypothetical protein